MATIYVLAIAHDQRNMLRIHRRYLRDATDPFYLPELRFIELFRLNKDAAIALLNEITPFLKSGVRNTFIPKGLRMVSALHFYATGSYLRDIGQDFACTMSKTMICRSIKEVTLVIEGKLMDKYIKFPTTTAAQNIIQEKFFVSTGFPGAIGAIDCTHVKIKKPTMSVEYVYRNRKGYFSKNVQLICDYDLNILSGWARFGGSAHDSFIWENSKIKEFLERQNANNAPSVWLIGDSGYPLQPWLMTPFINPGNENEEKYNFAHIRARNCVERLNGVLKKVFGCMSHDRGLLVTPAYAGAIINACLTLHNFRKRHNLPMPEEYIEQQEDEVENEDDVGNVAILNRGRRVRDNLVRNYFRSR